MPITIPIEGAGDAPSEVVIYAALGSVDLRSSELSTGESSIDIESAHLYQAGSSIDGWREAAQIARSSISLDSYFLDKITRSIEVITGPEFLILVDALQEELSAPFLGGSASSGGGFGATEINARLTVNGEEVAIKAFNFQAPTGRLGSLLNVTLADPDISQVPDGADIKFELIVNGSISHVLIDNGKLQERDYTISYSGGQNAGPRDQVTFGALDVMADKFTLAPRRPVIMYDPGRVKFDDVNIKTTDMIRDERGNPIYPVMEPVYGLNLRTILNRAYTGHGGSAFVSTLGSGFSSGHSTWSVMLGGPDQIGCGFSKVVTNIPDYKIKRVDFTLDSGWHDGATPGVAMYAPIYFVHGTTLFILDPDKPLPYGVSPHTLTLGDHKSLSQRISFKPDQNAVLLTYQYAANDPGQDPTKQTREVFSEDEEIIEDIVPADGVFDSYVSRTRITTRRWTIETYMPDNPTEVLASYEKSTNIETRGTVRWASWDLDTGEPIGQTIRQDVLLHQETSDYQYYTELKVGHQREIKAAVKGPSGAIDLRVVERETTDIAWTDDPYNPGVKLQDRLVTRITGAVYYDPENQETVDGEDVSRPVPILAAQASGILDANYLTTDHLTPIRTIRETLRNMSGRQFDVEVLEIDHLNNTVKKSRSTPVTGNVSVDPYATRSRTVLFRDTESEAEIGPRIPVSVNAYELTRVLAFQLARQVLYRLAHPLTTIPIELPGVDFAIDRGSIVRGQIRDNTYTPNHFVTGYGINGTALGTQGHRISQSLETIRMASEDEVNAGLVFS